CHCSTLPVIPQYSAQQGSSRGQRAMVGLLGSLVQLDKAGLLDCILYLSGVSGSTWCMASLYQEPDWSTKLETVKNKIIERLNGPGVSWEDAMAKLQKYYYGKDHFSLTDLWAVMLVTEYFSKDPLPIYTVIDKQSKQREEEGLCFCLKETELMCSCQLLYDGVFCLQTPGLRSVHMKQVILSLELL
uniref:PLA2c domain-containing protein n=1 Tax=Sinocyclocheilus grahami TaxID=75366 RepID=A0A672SPS0_SINGR